MRSKFKWIFTLLVALTMQFSFAQEKTVTGVASDNRGPIAGVNIKIKGSTTKAQSGFDGKYSINTKVGDVLLFTFTGMKDQSRVVGASNTINVVMLGEVSQLEDVIVTGFTTKKAVNVSSAVGKVSSAEMEKLAPMTTIDNGLQGKVAGVQVVANGGRPGQPARITIRGANGLNGSSNPLYVVDGVFMTSIDMLSINPADVESQTILKDAAAASLYGARGGNGVIVVTTKRGTKNKTTFQFNSSYSVSERVDTNVRVMDAGQYLDFREKMRVNGVTAIPAISATDRNTLIQNGTDWNEELFRTGEVVSNGFQVNSNTDTSSFFGSVSSERNTGIIRPWQGLERITGRIKFDQKMRDNITIGANIAMSVNKDDRTRESSNVLSPIFAAFRSVPTIGVFRKNTDGSFALDANGRKIYNTAGLPNNLNYFDIYDNYKINTRQYRTFGGVYGKYDNLFVKGLSIKTDYNAVYTRDARETWVVPGSSISNAFGTPTGSKTDTGFDNYEYRWVNTLNYNREFGKNAIDVVLFSEQNNFNQYSYTIGSTGYATNFLNVQSVGSTPVTTSTNRSDNMTLGYGLNVSYGYDDKYLFEGSLRRDSSSSFGKDSRVGYFPSASLAWKLSEEEFIKNIGSIDLLKLRVSYGLRGTTAGIPQTYNQTTVFFPAYNNTPGAAPSTLISGSSLGWQTSTTSNAGLEFGLLNNRLTGTVDYFIDKRSGFYFVENLAFESGAFQRNINAGEFTNKGYEISLSYQILKDTQFKWGVSGNYTNVKNVINDLYTFNELLDGGGQMNRVGQQLNSFFLVRYAGVNPANGEALYLDKNGNVTNVFAGGDAVLLEGKTPNPTFYGGFGTNFAYKGFDLSADFSFQGGNYIYNLQEQVLTDGSLANSNFRTDAGNFWTTPGQTNVLPKVVNTDGTRYVAQGTDQYLQKGDFIRFRTLNFGYTFGRKQLEKTPFSSVRFYLQGMNLFTWTQFAGDPEAGNFNSEDNTAEPVGTDYYFQYPNAQTYTFGMQIKF